jgi:hypothetical protein
MSEYPSVQTVKPKSPCDPAAAITRSLLGWGVVAGPFYLVVGLVQAFTRSGFDIAHDDLSVLANGSLGWIQMANLILAGAMTLAAAVGVTRATGSRWAGRLIGGYGVGLVLAGIFTADPTGGELSWHGMLHLVTAAIGFLCLVAACFVVARRFWPWYSRLSGILFLLSFFGVASGSGSALVVFGFWLGIAIAWAWLAAVCVHLYRATPILAE